MSSKSPTVLGSYRRNIRSVCALPGGRIATGEPITVGLWDVASAKEMRSLGIFSGDTKSVCDLPGTPLLAAANSDNILIIDHETRDFSRLKSMFEGHGGYGPGHSWCVHSVCALPDGRVVSGGGDGAVFVWAVGRKHPLMRMYSHTLDAFSVCVLPDGSVASSHTDGSIGLHDLGVGKTATLGAYESSPAARSVCALSDGRLAAASDDGTVNLWNLRTQTIEASLAGHVGPVRTVCALPDGRLVTGGEDRLIKVWNIAETSCVETLEGHTATVTSLCVVSGGFASGSLDGTVRIWA